MRPPRDTTLEAMARRWNRRRSPLAAWSASVARDARLIRAVRRECVEAIQREMESDDGAQGAYGTLVRWQAMLAIRALNRKPRRRRA